MKMKIAFNYCLSSIASLILVVSQSVIAQEKCVKGDIEYSVATYSEEFFIDRKYGTLLDSLLNKAVFEYFRNTDIRDLPTKDKDKRRLQKPSESHVIEPLFVDLSSFTGVYGKRIWSLDPKVRRPTRFRCGYYHRLFLVSNNQYIELTQDSIENENLIKRLFSKDFSDDEIIRMTEYFKQNILCAHFTFFPPYYIKRDEEILFDSKKLKEEQKLKKEHE